WSPLGRGRNRYRGLQRAAQRADRLLRRCLGQSLGEGVSNRNVTERCVTVARAVVHGLSVLAIDGHLKTDGLNERTLKRLAWEAMRQLNRNDHVADGQSKKAVRTSVAPES